MQFDQRGWTQAQARALSLRKSFSQQLIKQKLRFEVRTGQRKFNLADALAEVEPFAEPSRLRQQPL
jgi:hypothetical protein